MWKYMSEYSDLSVANAGLLHNVFFHLVYHFNKGGEGRQPRKSFFYTKFFSGFQER